MGWPAIESRRPSGQLEAIHGSKVRRGIEAVSYTHLDVYKRQVSGGALKIFVLQRRSLQE